MTKPTAQSSHGRSASLRLLKAFYIPTNLTHVMYYYDAHFTAPQHKRLRFRAPQHGRAKELRELVPTLRAPVLLADLRKEVGPSPMTRLSSILLKTTGDQGHCITEGKVCLATTNL